MFSLEASLAEGFYRSYVVLFSVSNRDIKLGGERMPITKRSVRVLHSKWLLFLRRDLQQHDMSVPIIHPGETQALWLRLQDREMHDKYTARLNIKLSRGVPRYVYLNSRYCVIQPYYSHLCIKVFTPPKFEDRATPNPSRPSLTHREVWNGVDGAQHTVKLGQRSDIGERCGVRPPGAQADCVGAFGAGAISGAATESPWRTSPT